MSRPRRRGLPPIPLLLAAAVSVQGGAALAKQIFPALGPSGTSGLRLIFAAAILLLVFRPRLTLLRAAQWRAVIPYGLSLGLMNLTFYEALARIPLGLAVTLEFVGPLGVALFGSRRPSDLLWAALAAGGIVLITPWEGSAAGVDPLGVALALGAGACWAAYIVTGGRVSRLLPAGEAVSVGMVIAACVVLPFALADGMLSRLTPAWLGLGFGVAVLSSALPYSIEMVALKALPARTFGILMSAEPVVATLVGIMFLGELLEPAHWLAVACVSAASAGSALSARDDDSSKAREGTIEA